MRVLQFPTGELLGTVRPEALQHKKERIIESIEEALLALSCDKLGTVTRTTKGTALVMTAHGAGEWPLEQWDAATKRAPKKEHCGCRLVPKDGA